MDLDHFWKVAAMQYPEDHSSQWLDFMSIPLLESVSIESTEEELFTLPLLGNSDQIPKLAESLEEKMVALGITLKQCRVYPGNSRYVCSHLVCSLVCSACHFIIFY
jgi:hypothetical protein